MGTLSYIRKLGNQLQLINTDGTSVLAYPFGANIWKPSGAAPGPEPGTGSFVWPFSLDTVSSEYGPRDGTRFHEGIDLAPGVGNPIPVTADGTVVQKYYHANFGNHVIVDHGVLSAGSHAGKQVRSLYAHMENPSNKNVGDWCVKGASILGTVGNTGASFGAHLHFEIHVFDPGSGIVWNTSNDGGYRTAVNPRDFIGEYG